MTIGRVPGENYNGNSLIGNSHCNFRYKGIPIVILARNPTYGHSNQDFLAKKHFFHSRFFSCKDMMILFEPVPPVHLPDAHTQNGGQKVSSTPPHAVNLSQKTILIYMYVCYRFVISITSPRGVPAAVSLSAPPAHPPPGPRTPPAGTSRALGMLVIHPAPPGAPATITFYSI